MKASRYHPTSIFFHWAIFLLIAAALILIEYRGYLPKGDPLKDPLKTAHMLAGQLVLLFVVFRLAARFIFGVPPALRGPRWQTLAAQAVHFLLYLVMFALPIAGILFNQAAGREVAFFGWVLPQMIGVDKALSRELHGVHVWLGNSVYYLVGLHILGALWHQFVRRDGGLRRMWPGASQS
jgi:cytochrome b561